MKMEASDKINRRRQKALRIFAGLRTPCEIAADQAHIEKRTAELASLRSHDLVGDCHQKIAIPSIGHR